MSRSAKVEHVHKVIREVAPRVLTGDRMNFKAILATDEGEALSDLLRSMVREEDGVRRFGVHSDKGQILASIDGLFGVIAGSV